MAIGMGASSLVAFRGSDHFPKNKKLTIILITIAVISSIIGAMILPHFETGAFKVILAIMTIVSLPLLFIDRQKIVLNKAYRRAGIAGFVALLFAGSIIASSAFSILITIGLSQLFQLTTLQSTAMRRVIGLVQSGIIFTILALQGHFLLFHALSAIIGGSIGSYFGTKIAIKKGENFAKYALAIGAGIGAVALLWNAS